MKKITAFDVADYFIFISDQGPKRMVSNKKLQKLVYYAQAWNLAIKDKPLFNDKIEAWIHGPAIPALYGKYKKFGFNPIESESPSYYDPSIITSHKEILDEVWRIYSKYDANYLEALTHQEEPWINARSQLEFDKESTNEITHKTMKEFYKLKLKQTH